MKAGPDHHPSTPSARFPRGGRIAAGLAVLLLAACSSAPPRPAPLPPDDVAALRDYATRLIRHHMKEQPIVGLSIAVVDDQRVLWSEGFGFADRERNVPATAETLYRVGSISKLFADSAAMQLAEQGRLDIDAPIQRAIPDFSVRSRYPAVAPITLRNLMSHHAGLPRDRQKDFITPAPPPFGSVIPALAETDAAFAPDTLFSYSNLGITVVGQAVENAAGRPFAEHLQGALLQPLGMTGASFTVGPATSGPMAKAYAKGEPRIEPGLRDVPAGGLNASVSDLSRFLSMVFAGGESGGRRILKAETLAEMLRPQNTAVPLDLDTRIGLGWLLGEPPALRGAGPVAHHGGATLNFRASLYALPERKLGVVVLANSAEAGPAVEQIAINVLSVALESRTGVKPAEPEVIRSVRGEPDPATLAEWVGDYATVLGHGHVEARNGFLVVHALGKRFDLYRRDDGRFGVGYKLLGLYSVNLGDIGQIGLERRVVAGRQVLVGKLAGREVLIGEKLPPPRDIELFRPYLGRYDITNLGDDHRFAKTIRLREAWGYLQLEVTGEDGGPTVAAPVLPLSDDSALVLSTLADGGDTVRCRKLAAEVECASSGYVLKRVGD